MRKTVILTVSLILAIASAVSCKKTEERRTVGFDVFDARRAIINAKSVSGGNSKAQNVLCYEALWDEGDRIFVTDGKNSDYFTLAAGEGTTMGTFVQNLDLDLNPTSTKISGEVEIFSPASLKVDDHYEWLSTQTAAQSVPMYARQAISGDGDETVLVSNLGAMLQIVLSAEKAIELAEIRIYDADKPMSGTFTVEDGNMVIAPAENSGITLDAGNVTIGGAAKYFNILVPAGKYEDLHLDFVFSDGRIRKMRSTTMPEIERNTVAKIAVFLDIANMSTKIELNHMDLDLEPEVSFRLTANVLPKDTRNKNVIWKSSDESVATVDQNGNVTGVAVGTATVTATTEDSWLTDFCIVTVADVPAGALLGKFSVSSDRQVYFSQGNLWLGNWIYDRTMETEYYFEDHQWQHQPLRDSTWLMSHRNHFFWSKFQEITLWDLFPDPENHATTEDVIFTNETETTPRKDFGVVVNGKRRVGLWRTLSYAEWHYLLEERPMTYGKPRYTNWWGGVKVEEPIFYGVFIYPDDYNGKPVDKNLFTWKELNDAGVAFLPMAGIRERTKIVQMPGAPYHVGWYWSSTPDSKNVRNACSVYIADMEKPKYEDCTYRGKAFSIRLVRDVRK